MEFPTLPGAERERGIWEVEDCPLRESKIGSKILKVSLSYPGSLSCRSSRPGLPKKASFSPLCANKLHVAQFPTILQNTSLLHPYMQLPTWDADSECQPNCYSIRTLIHKAKRLIPKST
jgi:hypothetical protein